MSVTETAITVREAVPEDAVTVAEFSKAEILEEAGDLHDQSRADVDVFFLTTLCLGGHGQVWLAEADGKPVGQFAIYARPHWGNRRDVCSVVANYVTPDARGSYAEAALSRTALRWVREHGFKGMQTLAAEGMAAKRLFARIGGHPVASVYHVDLGD